MRFIFKTDYDQDIRLFQHGGQVFWYGLLGVLLLAAPFLVSEYVLSQLHFICIYAIVGFGLMLLVGYTGQISLGHAAFLAVGAYTEALLQAAGVPFVVSLAVRGAVLGRGRHHRRPAGAAAEGHLSRDRDARLQRHRGGDRHALGVAHRRQPGQAAQADRDVRLQARQRRELLLSLPRAHGAVAASR